MKLLDVLDLFEDVRQLFIHQQDFLLQQSILASGRQLADPCDEHIDIAGSLLDELGEPRLRGALVDNLSAIVQMLPIVCDFKAVQTRPLQLGVDRLLLVVSKVAENTRFIFDNSRALGLN